MAPHAAIPVAAAPTCDCIFEVSVAVAMANDFPGERRADPRKPFHRYSPKSHPEGVERYPYRPDIKAFPHPGFEPADRSGPNRSCRLDPCLVTNEALSHTQKVQSQIVRCPRPLPSIAKTRLPRVPVPRKLDSMAPDFAPSLCLAECSRHPLGPKKMKADRWETIGLLLLVRVGVCRSHGCVGRASTTGLGTVSGHWVHRS